MKKEAGFTSKECPVCKKQIFRKSDNICPECLGLIETGRYYQEEYEKLKNTDDFIEVCIPYSFDGPRYLTFKTNQHAKQFEPVQNLLKELLFKVTAIKGIKPTYGYMQHLSNHLTYEKIGYYEKDMKVVFKEDDEYNKHYSREAVAIIHKEVFKLITDLHNAIEYAISETEKTAVQYGKNALKLLNNGDMTLDEFYKK